MRLDLFVCKFLIEILVLPLSKISLNFQSRFRINLLTITMLFTKLERTSINTILSHQFSISMIKTILKSSFIILFWFLNKKIPVFSPSIKYPCIFYIINKVYLNSVTMLNSINKLTIIYFTWKVIDHALVDRLTLFLTKIYTIFEFLNHRVRNLQG